MCCIDQFCRVWYQPFPCPDKARISLKKAYDALIAKIIASLRIEWSADARAQQAAAKQKWPDETLPTSLPELIWSDAEWRAEETKRDKEYQELVEAANADATPKPADMDERGDMHA